MSVDLSFVRNNWLEMKAIGNEERDIHSMVYGGLCYRSENREIETEIKCGLSDGGSSDDAKLKHE